MWFNILKVDRLTKEEINVSKVIEYLLENGPTKRNILMQGDTWPSNPNEHESHCFDFSENLLHELGKGEIMNHPNDPNIHQWVKLNNRHYDAQTPEGVDDWRLLNGLKQEEE